MSEGVDHCLAALPDDAPALKAAFAGERRFEPCGGTCCREPDGLLTDAASRIITAEFYRDFPEQRPNP